MKVVGQRRGILVVEDGRGPLETDVDLRLDWVPSVLAQRCRRAAAVGARPINVPRDRRAKVFLPNANHFPTHGNAEGTRIRDMLNEMRTVGRLVPRLLRASAWIRGDIWQRLFLSLWHRLAVPKPATGFIELP